MGEMLRWSIRDRALEEFEDRFETIAQDRSRMHAIAWYWFQIVGLLPSVLKESIEYGGAMFLSYLKMMVRSLKRQKVFSIINISGLVVSLTVALLIFLHVQSELNYETCFPKAERIYRIRTISQFGDMYRHWAPSAPAIGPLVEDVFPEVEVSVRLRDISRHILSHESASGTEKRFEEARGFLADPSVFTVFDIGMVQGDPVTALDAPRSIVLTRSMAERYFGDEDPIGQLIEDESDQETYGVTGVIADPPVNSHLSYKYLVSMSTFPILVGWDQALLHRTWKTMYTYVLLRSADDAESFMEKMPAFMKEYHSERPRNEIIELQPIRRIHLHSDLEGELGPNSNIVYVIIFAATAVLILFIAGANFVNMSTAQSFKRMKEIGIRKVIGARKSQVIRQHLGESLGIILIAVLLAFLVLYLTAIPVYNRMTGKALSFSDLFSLENVGILILLLIILGLSAGLYPAFFVSGFQPVQTLTSVRDPRSASARIRKGLVLLQFIISVFMIFCTLTIYRQLDYFHSKDLGFEKDRCLAVNIYGNARREILRGGYTLKTELLRHPGITHVTLASNLLGVSLSNERLTPVSVTDKMTLPIKRFLRVDEDFVDAFGLEITMGENFRRNKEGVAGYLISESTMEALNLEEPIGVQTRSDIHSGTLPIIGVFRDFHFASLHSTIEPLVLEYRPSWAGFIFIKFRDGQYEDVLAFVKEKLLEIKPDQMIRHLLLDDVFEQNYTMENHVFRLFRIFSGLALFVACLGLFGLTVYAAEVRIKEIGIRKVMGATMSKMSLMLSGEFLRWVVVANIIAWPLAYWAMQRWLQSFAYRIQINVWTFVIAGMISILIALATMSYQSVRAALANPVDSLRYE